MKLPSIKKYQPFPSIDLPDRQWPSRRITSAPNWSSVDLRDGNQSLPVPMSVQEKLEFFQVLVDIGFKEIEIGFPSAADSEFEFCRRLIDENLIPDDVTIQVLVQTREHLIRRTFEAIDGAKTAIVHIYNSTSPLQRNWSKTSFRLFRIQRLFFNILQSLSQTQSSNMQRKSVMPSFPFGNRLLREK